MRILILMGVAYLSVLTYIGFNQRSLLYFPDKNINEFSEYNLGEAKETYLTTTDGVKIHCWYKEPGNPKMPMAIYFHGNSGHLGKRELKYRELMDMGYGLIAISWRGFGNSEGEPSLFGLYEDARAAVEFLQELGYKTEDSILIGESLGTGLATMMATENKFKGLFLITPYTSIADRASEIYWYLPVRHVLQDNFISYDIIHKVNTHLLIVHGTADDIIPHTHSEKLFELAQEPKKIIIYPSKGHSNLDTREIFTEMTRFFGLSEISGIGVREFAEN